MEHDLKRETTVIGRRNPGTDSICSAICYANLRNKLAEEEYASARAGHVNGEAQFVLDYFGVEEPKLVEDMRTQVKDIEIHKTRGMADNISLKKVWKIVQENNAVTIPSIRPDGTPGGPITAGDITETYMSIYGSSILPKVNTQYSDITETPEADLSVGDADVCFDKGKVLVATANPDLMEFHIEPRNLVILGSRYESQLYTIEVGAAAVIICEGTGVSMTIKEITQDRGCTVIATTYDIYTTARLINQGTSINYFMTRRHLIVFNSDDYTDKIRKVMVNKHHRDLLILDREGRYLGMISRRNLLDTKSKQVILANHNEKSQAVAGIESAGIQEIIDHHRLSTIQTMAPVFFRSQPLGCTATIIYQAYQETGVDIGKKVARLLCSTIVSDTLLFRPPTRTPVDEVAARSLATIAELDIEKYAMEMFRMSSNLEDKSDEEIFYQDFKRFTADKVMTGVGQTASLNREGLEGLKYRMSEFMEKARKGSGLDMVLLVLTSILIKSADLIYQGQGAVQLATKAFHLDLEEATQKEEPIFSLPGVVSRKK